MRYTFNEKKSFSPLFWLLITISLVVDAINGFIQMSLNYNVPISLFLKVIILSLAAFYLAAKKQNTFMVLLLMFISITISLIKVSIISPNDMMKYDFPLAMRIIMLLFFTLCVSSLARADKVYFEDKVRKILTFNFYFLCANVLSGYLGLGHHTYPSTAVGYKGYFLAGNELSALFICLSTFYLFFVIENSIGYKRIVRYIISSVLIIVVGFSIATKSAVIGGVVIPFFIYLISPIRTKKYFLMVIFLMLFLMVFLSFLLYPFLFYSSDTEFISRAIYFYEQNGLIGLIFSGRQELLKLYFTNLANSNDIWSYLFGIGHTGISLHSDRSIIEIDFFDLMMYFGLPIAFVYALFSILVILVPLIEFEKRKYVKPIIISGILLLVFSFMAGHVWNSSLLVISWCLGINLFWIKKDS